MSLKVEWTLEKLLKVGKGNTAWDVDGIERRELGKENEGSKFHETLKGSVIQVLKESHQIFVKPLKPRRY